MSRHQNKVQVNLYSGTVTNLSQEELLTVLYAANDVAWNCGRSMLVKLLKGSRDKTLLSHNLDQLKSYGTLSHLSMQVIGNYVDWSIEHGYLDYYYDGKLPFIELTQKGWELLKPVKIREYYELFCEDTAKGELHMPERMENTNNDFAFAVIEYIGNTCDSSYIPYLEKWADQTTHKRRGRLHTAIKNIKEQESAKNLGEQTT